MGSPVRASPFRWACCSICLVAVASGERGHKFDSANALRLDEGEAVDVGSNFTVPRPKTSKARRIKEMDATLQEIKKNMTKSKSEAYATASVEAAKHASSGVKLWIEACSGTGGCDTTKVAQGTLEMAMSLAVFLPVSYTGLDVQGVENIVRDLMGEPDKPLSQVMVEAVVHGLNLDKSYTIDETVFKAQTLLRDFIDQVSKIEHTPYKPDNLDITAKNHNIKLENELAELSRHIGNVQDMERFSFTNVMKKYTLGEGDDADRTGTCQCDSFSFACDSGWEPCLGKLEHFCGVKELCDNKYDSEPEQLQCLRNFRKTLGSPTAKPENYYEQMNAWDYGERDRQELLKRGGDEFISHFPHGHMAMKCNGAFDMYPAVEQDGGWWGVPAAYQSTRPIERTWPKVINIVEAYYRMQASRIHGIARMIRYWSESDSNQKKNRQRKWEAAYEKAKQEMRTTHEVIKRKRDQEESVIHQFNMQHHSLVKEWRNSKGNHNRARGWMYAWMERPEVFKHWAGEAFDIADAFIQIIDQKVCPYVALQWGQNCHDSWDTAELDDEQECIAAARDPCFEGLRGADTWQKGSISTYPNKQGLGRERPTGCSVVDFNQKGELSWNTYDKTSPTFMLPLTSQPLFPLTRRPSNVGANYVDAFPICRNLKYQARDRDPESYIERSLVADEGNDLGSILLTPDDDSLEQCKDKCTNDPRCNSFAVCIPNDQHRDVPHVCFMKDKVVTAWDASRPSADGWQAANCKTYHKPTPVYTRRSLVPDEGDKTVWAGEQLYLLGSSPETLDNCETTCNDKEGCTGFTFCRNGQACRYLTGEKKATWVHLFGTGNKQQNDKTTFNSLFRAAPSGIVRRECSDCAAPFQDVYIKVYEPQSWDAYEELLVTWTSSGRGTVFNIYSSLADALAGTNAWQKCKGPDNGVGFPRDCGPHETSVCQWTSLSRTHAGCAKGLYRYWVYMDTPVASCAPEHQEIIGEDHGWVEYSGTTEAEKDASCCAKCDENPMCISWVRATDTRKCWLKKGFSEYRSSSDRRGAHKVTLANPAIDGVKGSDCMQYIKV